MPSEQPHAQSAASSTKTLAIDILMVGSGISGLFCALKLADAGHHVLIVTKNALTENNSRYAQGGIAAVLPENTTDSLAAHTADTLEAGAGLCDTDKVKEILAEGHLAIADLLLLGVPFDRDANGELALTLEGGHQAHRILHAGGDATGKQVELTLTRHIEHHPRITVMAYSQVTQLHHGKKQCTGATIAHLTTGNISHIAAGATILATGGAGRLFTQTTNPEGATGNGFVLAAQAGATLVDMAFIQFHPTGFVHQGETKFLLSEALRGEGGILRDAHGKPLMADKHPLKDLAPRDIVARAIHQCLYTDNNGPVTLDMTHHSSDYLAQRFPNIAKACHQFDLDMGTDLLPVAPAAHYMMGGIEIDSNGFTGIEGLYAIGETVWTGLHGANRLASNSLLECVVIARNVAKHLSGQQLTPSSVTPPPTNIAIVSECPDELAALTQTFRVKMTTHAGIIRDDSGLTELLSWLNETENALIAKGWHQLAPYGVDLYQQCLLAKALATCAKNRTESRGSHTRSDYPERYPESQHQTLTLDEQGNIETQWVNAGNQATLPIAI